jgi:hypothetical protein
MVSKKIDIPSDVTGAHGQTSAPPDIPALTPEERYQRIAEGAYRRAAARDFIGGDPLQDWLDAENDFNASVSQESTKGR